MSFELCFVKRGTRMFESRGRACDVIPSCVLAPVRLQPGVDCVFLLQRASPVAYLGRITYRYCREEWFQFGD